MTDDKALIPKASADVPAELQSVSASAMAVAEIEAAIVVAKRFPRDEMSVWAKATTAVQRATLARKATYSYPRGGKNISGPSVYLARPLAQYWGNIRWGCDIIGDDDESVHLKGWAWDVETNAKSYADAKIKKLIYRKKGGWQVPDERDLRELVNKNAAILKRNCLLELLPPDLVEDCIFEAKKALTAGIKDPKSEAKQLIKAMKPFGVTPEMMSTYVESDNWSADDIVTLQGVLNALQDNVTNAKHYFKTKTDDSKPANGTLTKEQMTGGDPSTHVGYDAPASGTSGEGDAEGEDIFDARKPSGPTKDDKGNELPL